MKNQYNKESLERIVARINKLTESPLEPYSKVADKFIANVGCYHLDWAYGGVKLIRMDNKSGGIRDVLNLGFQTKKECYHSMHAFIRGIEARMYGH